MRFSPLAVLAALASAFALASHHARGAEPGAARLWTPPGLSSDQYESSPFFSPDGRELFFMRSTPRFADWRILHSRLEPGGGGWTAPEPMPFTLPLPIADADPSLSPDGQRLFFVSNRTADGNASEELDIWCVHRQPDGGWGPPQRLPEPVNSPGSELLPRMMADGRLVFGSDRPGGFGQGDIYLATPQPSGTWKVENFGPPVSTPANEYEADISQDGKTLVLVADRGDRSHLYRFELLPDGTGWRERGRISARADVFQVGPLLSPKADRLLFAEDAGEGRSGEILLIDLSPNPEVT